MTEYFAIIDDHDRHGPFYSIGQACRLLKQTSQARSHTEDQARHFFLIQSAVEQVDTIDGKAECFRLNWVLPEKRELCPEIISGGL